MGIKPNQQLSLSKQRKGDKNMEYTLWLKTFDLEDNEDNRYLFESRNDMGFWFDEYQTAKENGALSENQIRAMESGM
jgi:nuclear transport factor 2 (NTF2) superfamily protein